MHVPYNKFMPRPELFLLVDLWDFFFRLRVGVGEGVGKAVQAWLCICVRNALAQW